MYQEVFIFPLPTSTDLRICTKHTFQHAGIINSGLQVLSRQPDHMTLGARFFLLRLGTQHFPTLLSSSPANSAISPSLSSIAPLKPPFKHANHPQTLSPISQPQQNQGLKKNLVQNGTQSRSCSFCPSCSSPRPSCCPSGPTANPLSLHRLCPRSHRRSPGASNHTSPPSSNRCTGSIPRLVRSGDHQSIPPSTQQIGCTSTGGYIY